MTNHDKFDNTVCPSCGRYLVIPGLKCPGCITVRALSDQQTLVPIKKRFGEDGEPTCEGCPFGMEGEFCCPLNDHCPLTGVLDACPVHSPNPDQGAL